jgi:hypothetical protein
MKDFEGNNDLLQDNIPAYSGGSEEIYKSAQVG